MHAGPAAATGAAGPHQHPQPLRDFGLGAQVLADLGVHRIRLLTNHPKKIVALQGFGIEVTECVPIEVPRGDCALSLVPSPRVA
jgi:GTP cyclohydrolase II